MKEKLNKIKYWFVNVFWFHYKWLLLGLLVAGIICFVLFSGYFRGINADYSGIITSKWYLTEPQFSEIREFMSKEIGDLNEDGYEFSELSILNMTPSMAENNRIKLVANFANKEVVFYILDDETFDDYRNEDIFEPMSTFGLPSEEEYPCALRVDQYPVFDRAGLAFFANRYDAKYYAVFLKISEEDRENPEMMQRYDLGVEMLQKLIGME